MEDFGIKRGGGGGGGEANDKQVNVMCILCSGFLTVTGSLSSLQEATQQVSIHSPGQLCSRAVLLDPSVLVSYMYAEEVGRMMAQCRHHMIGENTASCFMSLNQH